MDSISGPILSASLVIGAALAFGSSVRYSVRKTRLHESNSEQLGEALSKKLKECKTLELHWNTCFHDHRGDFDNTDFVLAVERAWQKMDRIDAIMYNEDLKRRPQLREELEVLINDAAASFARAEDESPE